jgi:hypothetical protein
MINKNKPQEFSSFSKTEIAGIKIDVRSPRSLYIEIGDQVIYIDYSIPNELTITHWHVHDQE